MYFNNQNFLNAYEFYSMTIHFLKFFLNITIGQLQLCIQVNKYTYLEMRQHYINTDRDDN